MAVIGFHFTKMSGEKKKLPVGDISISNNIAIINVKDAKVNMPGSKQKGAEISFRYITKYEPAIADILLEGSVVLLNSDAKLKEAISYWDKEAKLLPEIVEEVYNYLLGKCSVEAILMARELQLPPQIPLPKVSTGKNKE